MNGEMLRIYRDMLEAGDLKREDAELIKANLEEEKKQVKAELDKLYDDGGMLEHSPEITNGENIKDEINDLLDVVNEVLAGRNFSVTEKENKEELENNADIEDIEEEEYDEEIEEEPEEYEDEIEEDEPEDIEDEEEYEDEIKEEPENNSLLETTIELNEDPDDEYREEAIAVIGGRKKLVMTPLAEVIEEGEKTARALMGKIQNSEKTESEEKSYEQTHDYDKDERTR